MPQEEALNIINRMETDATCALLIWGVTLFQSEISGSKEISTSHFVGAVASQKNLTMSFLRQGSAFSD
jgi:hypothetical protein